MNTELYEHVDTAEVRAHVCPMAGKVYEMDQAKLAAMLADNNIGPYLREHEDETSRGKLIPLSILMREGVITHVYDMSPEQVAMAPYTEDRSTKGRYAVDVCKSAYGKRDVALDEESDTELQYAGVDGYLDLLTTIQVKYDERGGYGKGCTLNLYIETAERNPNKQY